MATSNAFQVKKKSAAIRAQMKRDHEAAVTQLISLSAACLRSSAPNSITIPQ